jgi:tetratricopeptide (TPR) repeat protein
MKSHPNRLGPCRGLTLVVRAAASSVTAAAAWAGDDPSAGPPPPLTRPDPLNPPPLAPIPVPVPGGPPAPESGPPPAWGPPPKAEAPPAEPQSAEKPGQAGKDAEKQAGKEAAPADTPEQRAKLLEELYTRLATAPDEDTGAQIASAIEQLWQHSGSPTADLLVARATAALDQQRRDLAMKLLNAAVDLQPDYAEAWNRRSYVFYLDDDYKRALGDIRRVLALEPHHYKALEGLANILQHIGEKKAALEAYETLLKVYPSMPGAKKARDDLKAEIEGQGI